MQLIIMIIIIIIIATKNEKKLSRNAHDMTTHNHMHARRTNSHDGITNIEHSIYYAVDEQLTDIYT